MIAVLPNFLDFPVWRHFLKNYGECFKNVIVMFNENNIASYDYTKFFHAWLAEDFKKWKSGNIIVQGPVSPPNGVDWRHHATTEALKNSNADYVWFMEPDFLARWIEFKPVVFNAMDQGLPIVGFYDQTNRLHPACLIVIREALNYTSRNFSANPPFHDHFGGLMEGFSKFKITTLQDLGLKEKMHWYHIAGLTYNYQRVLFNEPPVHNVPEFLVYNFKSRSVPVEQSSFYLELSKRVEIVTTSSGRLIEFC